MHTVKDPVFSSLIDPQERAHQLATGFLFTEGPVWHPVDHYLLFSDMPGDVRRKWSASDGVKEVLRPANKCNGLTFDRNLDLLACEHSTSCVAKYKSNGSREVLASHFEGQELNSPNDLCVRSDGAIYFTDPWYGRMDGFGVERSRELGWQGVFMIPSGSTSTAPELVVDRYQFSMPNGLCFSPDESLLYINDTEQANIRVFDVKSDGSLSNSRLFATGIQSGLEPGVPDGMKCDAHGNVWVTGPGGVWVYNPDGRHIGVVKVPEMVANLHWGGADMRTLYLCASTSVYTLRTQVGPRVEPFMIATGKGGGSANNRSNNTHDNKEEKIKTNIEVDVSRCALVVQEFQNDVASRGGAFESSGSARHCAEQGAIENVSSLISACRQLGIPVIHVWFTVQPGTPEMTMNTPLFQSLRESGGLVNGTWGAAPVSAVEPVESDFIVYKTRMSPWEGTNLETILKATGRDTILNTGGWTNLSIEHTARTGADKGFRIIQPEDACFSIDADWHRVSIEYSLQFIATVTNTRSLLSAINA